MAAVALVLWLVYLAMTLGVSVARQLRRTGKTGLVGRRTRRGSPSWAAELGHELSLALGFTAPILALAGVVSPVDALDERSFHVAGVVFYCAGLAGVVAGQAAMGESWRIGTDPQERTGLVTHGPFAVVRHPIYVALIVLLLGLALLVPSIVALASVVLFWLSAVGEVRMIEEPHLARMHGQAWSDYAAATGRFLPRIGASRASARRREADAGAFVARFADAWSDPDPAVFRTFWHDDGRLLHPTMNEPIMADAIPPHIRGVITAIPDVSLRVVRWASRDEHLFIEWELVGTLGGERIVVPGVDRFTLRGARAIEAVAYFDSGAWSGGPRSAERSVPEIG